MANKIKCEVCKFWHGGFHLCIGTWVKPARPAFTIPLSEKSSAIQKRRQEEVAERNRKILLGVDQGQSIHSLAKKFDISRQTVRNIIHRHNRERAHAHG